ncbi:MAG: PEP/pyruvate-binding domain-containing protein [Thermodesulforhabdaceae bacterium]
MVFRVVQNFLNRFKKPKIVSIDIAQIFEHFQKLLQNNQRVMELIADLGEKSGGEYVFDRKYLVDMVEELHSLLLHMVQELNFISSNKYLALYTSLDRIITQLETELRGRLSFGQETPIAVALDKAPLDRPELIGGKANTLAIIYCNLKLPIPPNGLVITTRAYQLFLEANALEDRIYALLESWVNGERDEHSTSRQIRYHILAGIIPKEISKEIEQWVDKRDLPKRWAVRSSAYGENGELSFAGIHETMLNVPPKEIPYAYKRVLASLYSPEALVYRRKMNMLSEEAAMAVIIQEMVHSKVSGVIHTVDVSGENPDSLVIYASWGLGRTVVEGRDVVDRFIVEKVAPYNILKKEIATKTISIKPAGISGEKEEMLTEENRELPTLSEKDIVQLVKWALTLERYFKYPQEIEWAIDQNGEYVILQSRRLVIPREKEFSQQNITTLCDQYPILFKDVGMVVHSGVGSGVVAKISSDSDMENFPEGGVLVTKFTAPWLARIVPKASAIIAERGSAAGHLATIAREFRVPTLVGVEGATERLQNGQVITVDAKSRIIYSGRVKELLSYELVAEPFPFEDTPEFRLLRRLYRRIAPLHLIDPSSPDFTPEGCRSVHDMVRFIHEKAVEELINLPKLLQKSSGVHVYTLESEIPLGLKILDLGGGIDPRVIETGRLRPQDIRSVPLKALWSGLSAPGVWSTEPVSVDFTGMMSSLTKTPSEASAITSPTQFNLAVISQTYMNLHLHLGYHFNMIDTRVEPDSYHNYIYFRFVGGVTDNARRSRRAKLISTILSRYHFKVDLKEDLVVARVLHLGEEDMIRRLQMLGRLIGFTRQLDIQLQSDEDITNFIKAFYEFEYCH